jgi:cobalt-zinc-cadmium efflux system protein
MADTHHHAPANYSRAFAIGIALNLAFVVAEFIYGNLAHSLALVADASHNFSDVFSLLLAWGAAWLSKREPSVHRTYGFRRSSILASLANAVVLLVAVGGIAWEAVRRFGEVAPVAEGTVIIVAACGIAVNAVTAFLFLSGRKGDLNIRGAFLHMAADAGVSLGVVLSGVAILLTGWWWLDPVVSLVIAIVILVGTWGLLREAFNLAMDAVPESIDTAGVQNYLAHLPGVMAVHDLHIWGMSTTETALTAHLVIPEGTFTDTFLNDTAQALHDQYGIEHTTLQIETGDANQRCIHCGLMPITNASTQQPV